ncbi:MAG TPA: histidinol-phosphate transaminase [Methanoregulaceae archaeon]|nr:histidinol-phosphate transaminase [Methanoregulaceae archaeon]HQJ88769.1 histidinol-phosphate transaminase [Methanoregulaceae archaeon]
MHRPIPPRAVHGGLARNEQHEEGWLDFSANLNPFPPRVPWTPGLDCLDHYPDDRYPALKEAISRTFGRRADEITVGNGSVEVIRSFCQAALAPGDRVLIDRPTFGDYCIAAALAGASATDDPGRAVVRFLCNPNNPTGELRSREEVGDLLERMPEGCRLFLDEAFIELSDPRASMVGTRDERVFVLRSLTKAFAVPGIRIGFGFGDPDLVDRCERCRPPWSVNAFAEEFALAALREYPALEASRERIRVERALLRDGLAALGFEPMPAAANFICAASPVPVPALSAALATRQIRIRDCASFGLPGHIRVAVRTRDENRRLLEELGACLA